jgi:beta-glucosidase
LVAAVASVAKHTVVVVNAGSPVEMPWFKRVDAVLFSYFGGQQMGNAIADVIYGAVNPSARTTTTWAENMSELPVVNTTPINGELHYSEGAFIGYRAWRKSKRTPLIPFGHGLSYTEFTSEVIACSRTSATVRISNVGKRAGAHVVQLYAENSTLDSFERRLIGFSKVFLDPSQTNEIEVAFETLAFKAFDNGWRDIPGKWNIILAENAFEEGQSILIK